MNEVNKEMPNDEGTVVAEEVIAETQEKPEEKEQEVSTAETAEAEIVHESVSVTESYSKCPETGEIMHEVYEGHTVVETVEPEAEAAPVIAEEEPQKESEEDEKDKTIAELKARVAELENAEAELKQMKEAMAQAELKEKQNKAKAFASKQGLNVEDEAVAKAIESLDYATIAELTMADEMEAEAENNEQKQEVTMANYVDMEISGRYGNMLDRG